MKAKTLIPIKEVTPLYVGTKGMLPVYHSCSKAEAQFIRKSRQKGWKVYRKGWPDFICIKDDRLICVEVKGENDKLRPHQEAMLRLLQKHGIDCYLYCPDNRALMKRRKIKQSSDKSRKRTMNDNKEPAINIFDPERHVTKSQKYGTALGASLRRASHTSERAAPQYGLIGHRSIIKPIIPQDR